MVRTMEDHQLAELKNQIEGHVTAISTWAYMFEAMDQDTLVTMKFPSPILGEVGRSIQGSAVAIRELMGELT